MVKNRPRMVHLLLALGADPGARDIVFRLAVHLPDDTLPGRGGSKHRIGPFWLPELFPTCDGGEHETLAMAEAIAARRSLAIGPGGRHHRPASLCQLAKRSRHHPVADRHGVDDQCQAADVGPVTALLRRSKAGAIDIARLLLDAGADPDIRDDRFHATALGWADFSAVVISLNSSERGGVALIGALRGPVAVDRPEGGGAMLAPSHRRHFRACSRFDAIG